MAPEYFLLGACLLGRLRIYSRKGFVVSHPSNQRDTGPVKESILAGRRILRRPPRLFIAVMCVRQGLQGHDLTTNGALNPFSKELVGHCVAPEVSFR